MHAMKHPGPAMPLSGERVSLAPVEADDRERLAPFFADPAAVFYYLPDTVWPRNHAQFEAMMNVWNDGQTNFAFACRVDGTTIGLATLSDVDYTSGHGEVGIMLLEPFRGEGYASEAMALLSDYAFGELRLHRLMARVADVNAPSLALFERLGFVREGRLREGMRRRHGYVDFILFGLLSDEWAGRSQRPCDA
ncbi:MAG: GNAT family N-acetyltransferase [Saccharofermentanales bacterium]